MDNKCSYDNLTNAAIVPFDGGTCGAGGAGGAGGSKGEGGSLGSLGSGDQLSARRV